MAESTLSLTYWDLLDAVSWFAGWGTAHANEDNLARARGIVELAYTRFLYPEMVGRRFAHTWSFLSPIAELTWRVHKEQGTASVNGTTVTCSTALFESYGVETGDSLVIESGGDATAGTYTISSVDSETEVTLTATAGSGSSSFYIVESAWQYPLPDDFAHMVREFTYRPGAGLQSMNMVAEGQIERLYAGGITTGRPRVFAVRPKAFLRETGQRFEVVVWPAPASAQTVCYRYARQPGLLGYVRTRDTGTVTNSTKALENEGETFQTDGCAAGDKVILSDVAANQTAGIYTIASVDSETKITLTTAPGADGDCTYEVLPANLYHLGGMQHSDTLRELCLARAEEELDDMPGVHAARALSLLAASIDRDSNNAARFLGLMEDPSTGGAADGFNRQSGLVTYNTG